MAHVRTANRHGRADEASKHDTGYSSSGESIYSRRVARATTNAQFETPATKHHVPHSDTVLNRKRPPPDAFSAPNRFALSHKIAGCTQGGSFIDTVISVAS